VSRFAFPLRFRRHGHISIGIPSERKTLGVRTETETIVRALEPVINEHREIA
jgi:hypothetical protein